MCRQNQKSKMAYRMTKTTKYSSSKINKHVLICADQNLQYYSKPIKSWHEEFKKALEIRKKLTKFLGIEFQIPGSRR